MRAKRSKKYRKVMKAYQVSFNFREPYQILLDAPTILDAQRYKMHLGNMLENTLSGEIKPMITQCCIRHLYDIKPTNDAEQREKDSAIEVAKAAERRRCGHHELEEPLSALECLLSVVDPKDSETNRHRYVVASQEQQVRARMREIAGVPLIYMNRSVMILEPMAGKSEDAREREEKVKIRAGLKGRRGAQTPLKRKRDDGDAEAVAGGQDGATDGQPRKKKKLRGPSQPNPLSVMRSKKTTASKENGHEPSGKRPVPAESSARSQKSSKVGTEAGSIILDAGADTQRKRKRKRKPKEDGEGTAAAQAERSPSP